ncbi:hypothetical protein DFAR_710030 [Desulfarculales bacterium]
MTGQAVPLWDERGPQRSTLSYANQHRPSTLFRALFFKAMERFRAQGFLGRKKASLNSRISS